MLGGLATGRTYMLAHLLGPRSLTLPAALLLALALAACGGGSSSTSSQSDVGVKPVSAPACSGVEYGGSGKADALIVSDLPLLGDSKERSTQQNDAIRDVLEQAGWMAGKTNVAFQACDDSIAKTGLWDEARCKADAHAYANDPDVLAVIGTYNSGCAELMVPILNKAPGGGLAMVSPGNTLICLTESANTCTNGEPGSLSPSGRRNYARVVPNDAYQGAGLATFAKNQGTKKVYILYAGKDPTSYGQAKTFQGAAGSLGIKVAGFKAWDVEAKDYTKLMQTVKAAHPDGVLLAGLIEQHGADLIKDKVAVLGPNNGPVKLYAPDGFTQQSTIDEAGKAAAGMYASIPGRVPESLTGPGKTLVDTLASQLNGRPIEQFAPYAGQGASVVLGAIANSSPTNRAQVIKKIFATDVHNGITGSFKILPSGDINPGPITVTVAKGTFRPAQVINPSASLVSAARGG
jgi:branched-chain amino acid transport system substrate-binding protein